ncbi:MAG TPA: FAD:protein FMN transferase, partial [Pirellulales bacterium]
GFFQRQGKVPDEADRLAALAHVGWRNVLLDRERGTVRYQRPGVELNFGAIGKGYALDRAAEELSRQEVDDFLLHGGSSSVLARGRRWDGTSDSGWSIGIGHPLRPGEKLGTVRLSDRALGTSGSGVQFFRSQGKRYGHILDPRSGFPTEGVLSTTVLASDAATADALATACYVLGVAETAALCQKRPDVGVILTTPRSGGAAVDCRLFNLRDGEFTPSDEFRGEMIY